MVSSNKAVKAPVLEVMKLPGGRSVLDVEAADLESAWYVCEL